MSDSGISPQQADAATTSSVLTLSKVDLLDDGGDDLDLLHTRDLRGADEDGTQG